MQAVAHRHRQTCVAQQNHASQYSTYCCHVISTRQAHKRCEWGPYSVPSGHSHHRCQQNKGTHAHRQTCGVCPACLTAPLLSANQRHTGTGLPTACSGITPLRITLVCFCHLTSNTQAQSDLCGLTTPHLPVPLLHCCHLTSGTQAAAVSSATAVTGRQRCSGFQGRPGYSSKTSCATTLKQAPRR